MNLTCARQGFILSQQLSGGEQQMLAIGRALMTNPQLLIIDKATEGLAPLDGTCYPRGLKKRFLITLRTYWDRMKRSTFLKYFHSTAGRLLATPYCPIAALSNKQNLQILWQTGGQYFEQVQNDRWSDGN
jgi:hypothetical protein